MTVVISPLLSLMSNQVDHLRKLKIRAATLNSDLKATKKKEVINQLRESCLEKFIELLYITPEMINSKYQNQTGIIYTLSWQNCEYLA